MTAMSRRRTALLSAVSLSTLLACDPAPPARSSRTADERPSYAIGLHLGMRLRQMRADLDLERIVAGFRAGVANGTDAPPRADLDPDRIRVELARLAAETSEGERQARAEAARRNEAAAAEFLAANRTRPGVVELPSGVQYRILVEGDDAPPSIDDRVTVEYEGRLLDGAVFDTSKDRFAPSIVRLRRTPRAWQEVVPRVRRGGSVEIWVPAHVASGEHPVGLVGPGELVVFTLRLVAIDRHLTAEAARAPPRTAPQRKDPVS